jgi:hypothetical protein
MCDLATTRLKLTGPYSELVGFTVKGYSKENDFDFRKLLPIPQELVETEHQELSEEKKNEFIQKYGFYNSFDWRCENWDTKWNSEVLTPWNYESKLPEDGVIEKSGSHQISILFNTAWCPPINLIFTLSKDYPNVTFEMYSYYERTLSTSYISIKDGVRGEVQCPEEDSDEEKNILDIITPKEGDQE